MNKQLTILTTFLAVAFGLAYFIDFIALIPAIRTRNMLAILILGIARMYAPFIATVVSVKMCGLSIRKGLVGYGLRGGLAEYIIPGIFIPYVLYALSVVLGMVLGMSLTNPISALRSLGTKLPISGGLALILAIASAIINGSTINTVAAIGEEMGWRGFLLGQLGPRLGLYPAAIAIGIIWSLWHAPLILLAGYNYPHHPDLLGLTMFTAISIVWSIILSQLRVLSKSILPSSFMHGNINAVSGMILMTFKGDEIYTAPLGLLGLTSSIIVASIIGVLAKGKLRSVEFYKSSEEIFTNVEY